MLIDHLDIDELNLPGNINGKLQQLHNLTNASFGLLMAVAVLSFVSVLIQMLAFCFSPEKCCLSFLNFLFECIIGLIAFVGAVVVTATYSYVKAQVNGNLDTFGVKSFLSINFYAFVWSAVIVCILVVFSIYWVIAVGYLEQEDIIEQSETHNQMLNNIKKKLKVINLIVLRPNRVFILNVSSILLFVQFCF